MTTRLCTYQNGGPCNTFMLNNKIQNFRDSAKLADKMCDGCQYDISLPVGLEINDMAIYWQFQGLHSEKKPVLCKIIDWNPRSKTRQVKIEIDSFTKWVAAHNVTPRDEEVTK